LIATMLDIFILFRQPRAAHGPASSYYIKIKIKILSILNKFNITTLFFLQSEVYIISLFNNGVIQKGR
jgi:hypothetical protein